MEYVLTRFKSHTHFTKKNLQSLNLATKKNLDECSSTLEFFLVNYVHIFIFFN